MVTAVLGIMIGAGVVNLLTEFLGEKIMSDWGWRIPFLLSLPTGLVSIYIRNRFEENTTHLREAQILSRPPLREVFLWKRSLIFIALITPLHASLFYLVMIYSPTWLSQFLKVNHSVTFHYTMFSYLIAIAGMLTGAVITDRIGRRFFLIFVSIFSMINIAMFFSPYVMTHIKFLLISLLSLSLLFGLYTSSLYALMSELLPTHVRATGLALAYNIPVAIFGGSTPLIATWLVKVTGNMSAPGVFFVFTGIISTVGLCFIRRRDYIGIDTI